MKGSYAPLHKLPPDHGRNPALLQQVRQILQRQALFSPARQSAGCRDLLRVRIKGLEHSSAQRITSFPPLCFPAGSWPWFSVSLCCRNLSRFLYPQTVYRSEWSFASDVHCVSARSSFAWLDDAAQAPTRGAGGHRQSHLQKEAQRRVTQALKEEGTLFFEAPNAEWVG
jgi:hypothetical protein